MSKRTFGALAGLMLVAGVAGGYWTAWSMHDPMNTVGKIQPMWAHDYQSLGEMARDVDAVVLGTVTDVREGRSMPTSRGQGLLPFTNVDLTVNRVIRGEVDESITIEQTGGVVGEVAYYVESDGGPYAVGEQVLLFLKAQPDTSLYYVAHPMGRFHADSGKLQAVLPDHPVARELNALRVEKAIARIPVTK